MNITVIDTSFGTWNLGDEVIMEAVNNFLFETFPDARVFRIPSHERLSRRSYYFLRKSDLCLIGGTNILASRGWRLRWFDLIFLANAICFGVTWGGTRSRPAAQERLLLRRVLARAKLHSVRDSYTKGLLDALSIPSVCTACPSMWMLTPGHCAAVPKQKAQDVLYAVTSNTRDPLADRAMIDILRRHYRTLYLFPQSHGDEEYVKQLGIGRTGRIAPSLRAFDHFLANEDVDFVGSRLHGGIRALQFKKRTLIIGIDHRSAEIAKDTGLPVLRRSELHSLDAWITTPAATEIRLPEAGIRSWKVQFTR